MYKRFKKDNSLIKIKVKCLEDLNTLIDKVKNREIRNRKIKSRIKK